MLFSKACLFWAKSFSFVQAFPYRHPKQLFSTLHLPFAPSHNLLSAKNTAILLQSALNPYAVTPERRTDSKPFRRRFVRKAGFGSCRRKALLKSSSTELWIEVAGRSPVCFLVTFCTTQKVTIRSLCREFWGFPNLESAHPNNNFPLTKLKPFPREIRGSANLESAHKTTTSHKHN